MQDRHSVGREVVETSREDLLALGADRPGLRALRVVGDGENEAAEPGVLGAYPGLTVVLAAFVLAPCRPAAGPGVGRFECNCGRRRRPVGLRVVLRVRARGVWGELNTSGR